MTDRHISDVERFYDANVARELERLEQHRTEYAVTLRAIDEYLPLPPAEIIDIGGGPGRYALPLAERGYAVTLVELSRQALAAARQRAGNAGTTLAGYVHASATDLVGFPDERSDAVLLLGPLYHLLSIEARQEAVQEACRVLCPGGVLFAAFITRYAPIRWAAKNRPTWIIDEAASFEAILDRGLHDVGQRTTGFTHAYCAHPSEVRPLMEASGLQTLDLIGCEGVVSMIEEGVNALQGEAWDAWVDLNYRLGKDLSIHGAVEHLLYVGKKRG